MQAISTSVVHAAAGLSTGSAIELLLPRHSESKPLWETVLTTAVQLALNGVAISYSADYLQDRGGTGGFIYSYTLMESQPELAQRVRYLGESLTAMSGQRLSQMGAQMATA